VTSFGPLAETFLGIPDGCRQGARIRFFSCRGSGFAFSAPVSRPLGVRVFGATLLRCFSFANAVRDGLSAADHRRQDQSANP
jgi:hypothetical protein